MDFQFPGNTRNIVGQVRETRYFMVMKLLIMAKSLQEA